MNRPRAAVYLGLLFAALALRSLPAAERLDPAQVHDLFSQGKELFRRANELAQQDPAGARDLYAKAALRFERIVREGGVHNGGLYYNIGNAHFRTGDIGRAILSYLRAERYIPGDANLRQNLAYARSQRVDRIEPREQTRVLKTLFFWHYDLAPRARLALFAVCFAVVWLCAALRLFRRSSPAGWALVVAAVLAGLLFGSLVAEAVASSRQPVGVILAAEVIARKGDAETYQPSFSEPLHAGIEFVRLEERGEWLHVELADGRLCWVPRSAVGMVD